MKRRTMHRGAITATAAILAGGLSIAAVSSAQGGAPPAATSGPQSTRLAGAAPGGILANVRQALQGLVGDGTITQNQADAVNGEAVAGSIDPKTLVQSGVVTDPQMRRIADVIDQVKASWR